MRSSRGCATTCQPAADAAPHVIAPRDRGWTAPGEHVRAGGRDMRAAARRRRRPPARRRLRRRRAGRACGPCGSTVTRGRAADVRSVFHVPAPMRRWSRARPSPSTCASSRSSRRSGPVRRLRGEREIAERRTTSMQAELAAERRRVDRAAAEHDRRHATDVRAHDARRGRRHRQRCDARGMNDGPHE